MTHKGKAIIKKNWPITQSDSALKHVFPDPPAVSFKRAPTLKDKLFWSYLPAIAPNESSWLRHPVENLRCGGCNHCSNIVKMDSFVDVFTQKTYQVRSFANCNTTLVVYRLERECGCFYIGRSKRKMRDRLQEHKYAIRTKKPKMILAVFSHFSAAKSINLCKNKIKH